MEATTKVITGKCRAAFVHLFEPRPGKDGKPGKYEVCLIIPKTDTETVDNIRRAVALATEQGKTAKWGGKIPPAASLKLPLYDGDTEREGPEFAGCYFINAKAGRQPGIVDRGLVNITDPDKIYSGCYIRASINFFPFLADGSKGVAAGLNNVQFLADGEPLGGGGSAAADFATEMEAEDIL